MKFDDGVYADGDPGDEQAKACCVCGDPLADSDPYICGECVAAELHEAEEDSWRERGNEE